MTPPRDVKNCCKTPAAIQSQTDTQRPVLKKRQKASSSISSRIITRVALTTTKQKKKPWPAKARTLPKPAQKLFLSGEAPVHLLHFAAPQKELIFHSASSWEGMQPPHRYCANPTPPL